MTKNEAYLRNVFVLSEFVFADVMKIYFSQEFIILNSVKIRFLEIHFKGWLPRNKFIEDNCDFLKRFFRKESSETSREFLNAALTLYTFFFIEDNCVLH